MFPCGVPDGIPKAVEAGVMLGKSYSWKEKNNKN
jgi:hypothetical protein